MTALVILTQAVQGGDSLARQLSGAGLQVERWPLVRLAPAPLDAIGPVLARLADYNWIFLPSPSAVRLVAQRMKELDVAWPPSACAGLVGPASVEAFRECFGEGPRVDTTAQPPHDAVHLVRALAGGGSQAPCVDGPIRALVLNRPDARTQWLESLRELAQSVEVVVAYTAEPAADGPPPHLMWRLQRLRQGGGVVHWVVGAGSHLDTLLKALPATLAQWTRRQPLLVPHAAILAHARSLGFENCLVYRDRRDLVERLQYLGDFRVRAPAEPACQPAHHDADKEEDPVLSPEQQKDSAIPGASPDGGKDAKATPTPGSPGALPAPARPVPVVASPSASTSPAAGTSSTPATSPGAGSPAPSSPLTKSPAAAGTPAGGSAASSDTPGDKSAGTSTRTSAPVTAGPAAVESGTASPSVAKPAAASPSMARPAAASASTARPAAASPSVAKPAAASPSTVIPGAAGSSTVIPGAAGSSTPKPGAAIPSPARPGSGSPATPAAAPSSASVASGPSAASTSASSPPAATSGPPAAMKPADGPPQRMAEPPAPVPPVPPSAGGSKRGGGLWALLTLLLVCLLAAGGWWYTQQRFLAAERDSARRVQEAEARAVKLEEQMKGLRDLQNQLQSRSTSLEEKLAQSATQQEQLAGLYDEIAKTRGDTALAEVEQSVQMANQHLELTGNVQAALLALQNAERRLGDSEESQGIAARRLIVQDIERLKALPEVDLARSAGRLDEVINSIDRLPLLADADEEPPAPATPDQPAPATPDQSPPATPDQAAPATPDQPAPSAAAAGSSTDAAPAQPAAAQDQPTWQRVYDSVVQVGVRGFEAVRDEFRSLVTVRRMDRPDSLYVSPEQNQAARENLKLLLLNARLNLLNRHENLFKQDLTRAIQAMERLHDTEHQDVKGAIATLKSLEDQPLALNLPSLGESLGAIRAARAASEKRS